MKNKKILLAITAFIYTVLIFFAGFGIGAGNYSPSQLLDTSNSQLNKLISVHDFLATNWLEFDSSEEMVTRAIRGMLDTESDPYAAYFTKQEFADYTESLEGAFVGIGVQFQLLGDYPIVMRTFDGSPAQEQDIRPGDILLEVNGDSLEGLNAEQVGNLVRGEENTSVKLTIMRGREKIEKTLVRAPINSSVISYVKDGVGVIEISQFAANTTDQVKEALMNFQSQDIESFVIDLRGNPGGYLNSVVDTADLFLERDKIVLQSVDAQGRATDYVTRSNTVLTKYQNSSGDEVSMDFVILIDGSTASAAEVLAAALNEHLGVELIGSNTFGKGVIQAHFPLKDGSVIKYTSAEWLTPKGKHIHKQGVAPTIELVDPYLKELEIFANYDTFTLNDEDPQIKSVKLMLNYLGYKTDNTDSRFDSTTVEAIKLFQNDQGLNVTGNIDSVLAKRLVQHTLYRMHSTSEDVILKRAFEVLK